LVSELQLGNWLPAGIAFGCYPENQMNRFQLVEEHIPEYQFDRSGEEAKALAAFESLLKPARPSKLPSGTGEIGQSFKLESGEAMEQKSINLRKCPACGSRDYLFRGRKKIAPRPGQGEAIETKFRCKPCAHEWTESATPRQPH
jgi:DNA-directed RNA polymerase subunit M/transcription elongation factor TFIIS